MPDNGFEYYPPPELPEGPEGRPAGRGPVSAGGSTLQSQNTEGISEPIPMTPGRRMLIISCVLLIGVSLAFILRATLFSIRFVRVIGIHNLTWQQVATSAGITRASSYFNIREDKIRDGVNSNRYLIYERMQKVFPNTLILYVKERQPVASINYIGVSYIMADDGLILTQMPQFPDSNTMMRISGLALRDIREGRLPLSSREGQIDACVALAREIYAQGFSHEIIDINLSEPSSIYLTTRDGYSVHLGDASSLKAKIGTVRAVLPELRRMGRKGGTIEATVWGEATHRPDSP